MDNVNEIEMQFQEEKTNRFLKTNGPPPGAFEPSVEAKQLAHGKTDVESFLILESSSQRKQNDWVIKEVVGLKGAHRVMHNHVSQVDAEAKTIKDEAAKRFSAVEETLAVFVGIRERWFAGKKMLRNIFIALFTIFMLPFLSVLAVEVVKHFLHWP